MKKTTAMHFLIGSFLFMLIYSASFRVQAEPNVNAEAFPFASYEARYKITWRGMDAGTSVHRLSKINPHRFYFEAITEPHLAFLPFRSTESTLFTWEKNEIKPHQFQYDINEGKKKRIGHLQFDWTKQKIVSLNSNDPFEMALEAHHQDKLTHVFMLRRDLQKTHYANQPITYSVATGDKSKSYIFESMGEETVITPMGKVQTIKLQNTVHGDRVTTIWFAKEWRYFPVKITHSRNGKIVTTAEIAQLSEQ